jgi:hypothetical protein
MLSILTIHHGATIMRICSIIAAFAATTFLGSTTGIEASVVIPNSALTNDLGPNIVTTEKRIVCNPKITSCRPRYPLIGKMMAGELPPDFREINALQVVSRNTSATH